MFEYGGERERVLRHLRFAPSNSVLHPCSLREWFDLALPNGGEGGSSIRTRMTQFLFVVVVHQDWSTGAEVVHPFKLGNAIIRDLRKSVKFKVLRNKHLLETALDWEAKRAANPHIQGVDIAKSAGLSPCRVNQILRFARLHPEIQKAILNLNLRKAKKCFPERLLRKWTPLPQEEQLNQFRAYFL